MGYEDRDYYQAEFKGGYQDSYSRGGGFGLMFDKNSVIIKLIVINVVIFLVDAFTIAQTGSQGWLAEQLSLNAQALWKVWSFVTYGFAHASFGTKTGIMHLVFNMLALFFLGMSVEQKLGKSEFIRFYLVAIVVSGIGWLVCYLMFPGASYKIVGASGAVSAVIVYFVFAFPKVTLYLMGVVPIPAWIVGVLFLVGNLFSAFDSENTVAWQAHLAGAAFGALYYRLGWNLGRFDFGLENWLKQRPRLRIHDPGQAEEKLKADADRILAKINESGEASLTGKERRILRKYSDSVRRARNRS